MTVSSSTSKVSFSGNGSLTTFAYSFKIFDQDDLTVILRAADGTETVQTITTHYTVTGVGSASGGNVVFGSAPASGVTIVILREQPLSQGLDLVANDPFPAESLEEALDKLVFMTQKHEEELGRAIKASRTNTLTGSEFTISATDRANKIFAFDGSGNVSITQAIGIFKGDWGASTSYVVRDIVKDTSTNNIFIANTAHTSSGSQPLTTNTDSAKWDLLVDAASATTSATASAASAATATTKASEAAASAATASTKASEASTSAASAATSFDNLDDRYLGAKSSDPSTDNDGDALITGALFFHTGDGEMKVWNGSAFITITVAATNQANINTVAGISSNVTSVAGVATEIGRLGTSDAVADMAILGTSAIVTDMDILATSANVTAMGHLGTSANVTAMGHLGTSANVTAMGVLGTSTNVTNMATVSTNISGVNSFAERYRVASSDPSSSLDEGDLAYNSTSNTLKYYNGSAWVGISPGIASLAADGSPQLGGNLDMNGNDIVTTSNADLDLAPNGTGRVVVKGNTNQGSIVLNCENNSHGITIQSAPHSASATYTVKLPNALGTSNASAFVTADANGVTTFDNGTIEESTSVTSSSNAATLNLRDGNVFEHTLTENVTYTFSNPAASGKVSSFVLKIKQDASGSGYTVTFPGTVDFVGGTAPTLTATANAIDTFVIFTTDGGTIYNLLVAGQDIK